ncbi:MAG: metallophosphoesterase [Deltaproteobacteria bacterium]|nr:metallophosphoesterase [Deltaproteobacteria bacterium]
MIAILAALLAAAPGPFEQYLSDNETSCIGKADFALAQSETWQANGFTFVASGAKLEVKAEKKGAAKLGLLSAVKDFSPETKKNLEVYLAAFKKAGVTAIVVDGDSAYGVDDQDSTLADVFSFLGDQGLPVYVIIGNSESRSAFNRGALAAFRKNHNVINLNLVRRVDGDGYTLVSLPGYFDRRFIGETSGCDYKAEDAQELGKIARGATNPVVLVTHGPPRQAGKGALDVTQDGKNVGDPDLATAIAEGKIAFGVFGHILESGGRATDLEGTHSIKPGAKAASIFVNPGPAFADPWPLNDGRSSKGMAAILSLDGKNSTWEQVLAGALEKPKAVKAAKGTKGKKAAPKKPEAAEKAE